MDQTTFIALDRLREELYRHRELTQQRFDRTDSLVNQVLEKVSKSTPPKKSPSHWDDRTRYLIGGMIIASLLAGWDIGTAIEKFTPLLSAFGKISGTR